MVVDLWVECAVTFLFVGKFGVSSLEKFHTLSLLVLCAVL
jgi:hypothetical protein